MNNESVLIRCSDRNGAAAFIITMLSRTFFNVKLVQRNSKYEYNRMFEYEPNYMTSWSMSSAH